MAIKTITAAINGGDAITAHNDLIFKIYDGGTLALLATTGSHTSDADVTVTGDTVVITNVDVGTSTTYRISSLDEAGNESVKSEIYSDTEYGLRLVSTDADAIIIPGGFTGDGSEITILGLEMSDANYSYSNSVASSSTNGFLSIAMRATNAARMIVADSTGKVTGTTYPYVEGAEISMRLSGQNVSLYFDDVLQQTITMTGYIAPAARNMVIGAFGSSGALSISGLIKNFRTESETFDCNEGTGTPIGSLGTVTTFVNTPVWEAI